MDPDPREQRILRHPTNQQSTKEDVIWLAYWFDNFLNAGNRSEAFSAQTRDVIVLVCHRNHRPDAIPFVEDDAPRETRATPTPSAPPYPERWVTMTIAEMQNLTRCWRTAAAYHGQWWQPLGQALQQNNQQATQPPVQPQVPQGTSPDVQAMLKFLSEQAMQQNTRFEQLMDRVSGRQTATGGDQQPTQPTVQQDSGTGKPKEFRPRLIGYFDPDPSKKPVSTNKDGNIYHNVFTFVSRIQAKEDFLGASVIAQNLEQCLMGAADTWFSTEIQEVTRIGFRNDPHGVKQWIKALEERFRESPLRSQEILMRTVYSIQDCRDRKPVSDYVQSIIANGRNSTILPTEATQVAFAFSHIDADLRIGFPKPNENSTMEQFLKDIRDHEYDWHQRFKPRLQGSQNPPPQQNNRRGFPQNFRPGPNLPYQPSPANDVEIKYEQKPVGMNTIVPYKGGYKPGGGYNQGSYNPSYNQGQATPIVLRILRNSSRDTRTVGINRTPAT